MAIDLAEAQTQLAAAIDALARARKGEYKVRDRETKPASLAELRDEVEYWDQKCLELGAKGSRSGRRVRGGTPT